MLRYGVSFVLTFVTVITTVPAANYIVDADGIYRTRTELAGFARAYVERLTRSDKGLVAVLGGRSIKLELARRSTADCMVLGSSREMELDTESAPQLFGACGSVINLAVPAGSFEDFVTT